MLIAGKESKESVLEVVGANNVKFVASNQQRINYEFVDVCTAAQVVIPHLFYLELLRGTWPYMAAHGFVALTVERLVQMTFARRTALPLTTTPGKMLRQMAFGPLLLNGSNV